MTLFSSLHESVQGSERVIGRGTCDMLASEPVSGRNLTRSQRVAAISVGVVAALVVNSLPVFLTVLARARGLNESESGLVALADMGGIAVGTTVCAMLPSLVQQVTWRGAAAIGLLMLCIANVASANAGRFPDLLADRLVAGCGSGIVMAITYAVLAQGDGARDLAIFNAVQLGGGAIGIPLLEPIASRYGAGGLFGLIAILGGLSVLLCYPLPRGRGDPGADATAGEARPSGAGWLAISSVLLYFAGAGAIYAYLSFMGVAWGGKAADVEFGLSLVLFAAMLGGVAVSIIGSRFGIRRSLYVGFSAFLLTIACLALVKPVQHFVLLGCLFGFSWNIVTPFQFEAVTVVDDSSSAAMLVNAATLGGLAVGPAIAGFLATPDYLRVNSLAFVAVLTSFILLIGVLRFFDRLRVARA
jgi:DHA1 family inner membrane transport protein